MKDTQSAEQRLRYLMRVRFKVEFGNLPIDERLFEHSFQTMLASPEGQRLLTKLEAAE